VSDLAGFLAHLPAQIDWLEAEALLAAEVTQRREDVLLEEGVLTREIGEGGLARRRGSLPSSRLQNET
jgi:hypothetical protein